MRPELVDVVNHLRYNDKRSNTNIDNPNYDTNYVYQYYYCYYLEHIFDYGFYHCVHKKKGIYRRKT